MEAIKLCIVLTVLALMARYASRLLMSGAGTNPGLAQWIDRLHFHWIAIIWILYLLPFHPFSLILAAATLRFSHRQVRAYPLVTLVFLVLTIPSLERRIAGVGGIDSLIFFGWPMALSLAIVFLARPSPGRWADFSRSARWLYVLFFLFIFLLSYRGTSFTDGMRTALNYLALFFLTAGVVYRARGEEWIAGVVYAVIAVGLLTAFISIFESVRGWLLFVQLLDAYGTSESHNISLYKYRGGMLRSLVAQGNLQTGLILSTSLIALVLARRQLANFYVFYLLFGILAAGLLFTFSRGPVLVGCGIILVFELFRSRSASIPRMAVFFGVLYGVLVLTGVVDILQSMFQIKDDFNFNYRVRLFDESVDVILSNFLLGTEHFMAVLAGRGLVQGEGIVDIVNTYLQIGLAYGGIALGVYVLLLVSAVARSVSRITPAAPRMQEPVKPKGKAGSNVDVFWLALAAAMVNVFIQSSSVSVLGYNGIFVFILLLVLVANMPIKRALAEKGVARESH
jgi:hypothetical protein